MFLVADIDLLWCYLGRLDFTRRNVPDDLTVLLQRPSIVPNLIGIAVEDADEVANVDRRAPINKRIACGAKKIAAVARRMLKRSNVANGDITVASESDNRCIYKINKNFSKKIISYSEKVWFEERSTGNKVLQILAAEQARERGKPWQWLREPNLNRSALDAEARRLVEENEKAHR